jgi:hypothetical protein
VGVIMDVFMEKIVTRKKDGKDYLITFGLIIGSIVLMMFILTVQFLAQFMLVIIVGIIYLDIKIITGRNVEYEYLVTNGDIDIDKIIARRKRKRIFSANCKSFDLVAKVTSNDFTPQIQSVKNRLVYSSTITQDNVYFISMRYKGENTVVFFEPSEKMLNNFKKYIPRNVKI